MFLGVKNQSRETLFLDKSLDIAILMDLKDPKANNGGGGGGGGGDDDDDDDDDDDEDDKYP